MSEPTFSTWEQILLAAATLEERRETPFTASTLVVEAWKHSPKAFCLDGMQDYPSDNRVLCNLMGKRGLVARGLLIRTKPKLYRLSPDGHNTVTRLRKRLRKPEVTPRPPSENGKLSKALEASLSYLLDSEALRKHRAGKPTELTLTEAFDFWDFGDQLTPEWIDRCLSIVTADLEKAAALGDVVFSSGRYVTLEEVAAVQRADDWMRAKFATRLNVLRKRKAASDAAT